MPNNYFIEKLVELKQKNKRAELAELRRAASEPENNFQMLKVIGRFLPYDVSVYNIDTYKQIACLFTIHQQHTENEYQNFGSSSRIHWRLLTTGQDSFEARFAALLNAHKNDLYRQIMPIVRQFKDIKINYDLLLGDVIRWGHPNKFVQKAWAKSFWGYKDKRDEEENE
jgi:CRISPR system Cascade subunit CasB